METTKRYELNKELAQMLKGGVIMDVTTPEQAKIAQEAGACAVRENSGRYQSSRWSIKNE